MVEETLTALGLSHMSKRFKNLAIQLEVRE